MTGHKAPTRELSGMAGSMYPTWPLCAYAGRGCEMIASKRNGVTFIVCSYTASSLTASLTSCL